MHKKKALKGMDSPKNWQSYLFARSRQRLLGATDIIENTYFSDMVYFFDKSIINDIPYR